MGQRVFFLAAMFHYSYNPPLPISTSTRTLCPVEYMLTLWLVVTLSLSDDDFGKLVGGKTQAQRLFMSGKLKIKGDIMKATKMEPVLKKAQTKAKL